MEKKKKSNKKNELKIWLESRQNGMDFALWMLKNQTRDELNNSETIEDNGIGFNKPDALVLTSMLKAIDDGTKFSDLDLARFYRNFAQKRLGKYSKQFVRYLNEKQITSTHS